MYINNENEFEEQLLNSLKGLGYLVPTTEEQVLCFEKHNTLAEVPSSYFTPLEILENGEMTLDINDKKGLNIELKEIGVNLSRAARNGKEIPNDVLSKMNSDRLNSENGKE